MAINPKDKLRDYTNRNMLKPFFPEAPIEINSINHRIRQGPYIGKILRTAYGMDSNYFEDKFFNLPSIDIDLSVKNELRELFFTKPNPKSNFNNEYLVYFKELDYKEMWIKFFITLISVEIKIKNESKEVIFQLSESVTSNQIKFPLSLDPGIYRLHVTSRELSFREFKFRVIKIDNKEYSIVESIRKKLHEFSNRKELFIWLRKRKYSVRQARRIINQVHSRSF